MKSDVSVGTNEHILGESDRKVRSLWGDAWRRLLRNKLSMVGLGIFVLLLIIAVVGPYITPYDYLDQDLDRIAEPPSADHWFGTDQLGRDYLSRVLYGARTAVLVALVVTFISNSLGIVVGAIAAYAGGKVDLILMYMTDVMMCFPALFFAILVNSTLKVPLSNLFEKWYQQTGWGFLTNTVYLDLMIVFGALGLVGWPQTARMIRSQILSLRERDYVLAAQTVGCPNRRIIWSYLIPNGLSPVIVNLTLGFAGAMISESSLSYLGIGIRPPGASWGAMIADNLQYWRTEPHLVAVPGIVLAIVTLGINFLGDGLNDALNPRSDNKVV